MAEHEWMEFKWLYFWLMLLAGLMAWLTGTFGNIIDAHGVIVNWGLCVVLIISVSAGIIFFIQWICSQKDYKIIGIKYEGITREHTTMQWKKVKQ